MKWFEPIIIVIAIAMVVIPFAIEFRNAITKKGNCSCGCGGCDKKDKCMVNFKSFISSKNFKNSLKDDINHNKTK